MSTDLLSFFSETSGIGDKFDYISHSSYDEMLELNIRQNTFRALFHIEDKYFLPMTEGKYLDLYAYTMDHLIHPGDREVYSSAMNPEGFYERLQNAPTPGILDIRFRVRGLDRDWRWVNQLVLSDSEESLSRGTVFCFVLDIQTIKDRESGVYTVQSKKDNKPDPLTGLPEYRDFLIKAEALLPAVSSEWIMLRIDLENFKLFNDWYGWENGNLVLARIGAGLRKDAEAVGGIAGYFGNDDFCLFAPENAVPVEEMYGKIHQVIVRHGVSVGFLPAFGLCRTGQTYTVKSLLDQAAFACDRAKADFKNRICYFSQALIEKKEKEYQLVSDFQKALSNHEITFFLQPQCRSSNGAIVGAEALARWIRGDGTFVAPGYFVPILEKYGFITDLDTYIWECVAKWIRSWLDRGNYLIPISVNVSQIDIFTIQVPEFLADLVRRYRLPWNAIKVEITESACADEPERVKEMVMKLRSMGFLVLMDDFGSGYSSLNMLHELEVDAIKLDAHFLHLERQNEVKGIHILESVVNMAKTMGLPIIVEGVENQEQKDFLRHLGCRYTQGFYFYHPMKPEDFEELISDASHVDLTGFRFKANEQFHLREFLDETVYSDSMLNTILGPAAIYSWSRDRVDIIRFNEQFYEAVNVPDFHERITDLQRSMPPGEMEIMKSTMTRAMDDRMNGASAMLSFLRVDGGISRFLIHFYYLGEESNARRFYGSARNVTQITLLQKEMDLIARFFSECLVFLMKNGDTFSCRVAAQGLTDEICLSAEEMEAELNSGVFYSRIVPEHREMLHRQSMDALLGIDFSSYFSIINKDGKRVNLFMKSDYVDDMTTNVKCLLIISRIQSES